MKTAMRRMPDDSIPHDEAPGAFSWRTLAGEPHLLFVCPCGTGHLIGAPIGDGGNARGYPTWTWDGDKDAPTLRPSIQVIGGCRWHGYVTAGQLETL